MAKKHQYHVQGTHYSPGKGFYKNDLEIDLPVMSSPGPVKGRGTPISKAAFDEMQKRYFKKKKKTDTESISFGREAILTILAQHNCAGIKFYFVERHNTQTDQLTLAMIGVDANNKDLKGKVSAKAQQRNAIPLNFLMGEEGTGHP